MQGILLGAVVFATLNAQSSTVSSSSNGILTAAQLATKMGKLDPESEFPRPNVSISLRKIVYASTDFYGKPTRVSGLLAYPSTGAPKGLIVFCHGTINSSDNAPSRYKGGDKIAEETDIAVSLFASGGYAVACPDYLGLGDNSGVHPYPLGSVNAKSAIDIVNPARLIAKKYNWNIGRSLFITGYSEGGGVAMWTAKLLQEKSHSNYVISSAVPMSGPYDLSGTMAKSLIAHESNPLWVGAKAFLASYCGYSLSTFYPEVKLKNLFVPSFASYVPYIFKKELDDDTTAKRLMVKAVQLGAITSLRRIVQPEAIKAIDSEDLTNPFLKVMNTQNIYNWKPEFPIYLVCLKQDKLVPAENTHLAYKAMSENGTRAVEAHEIDNENLTHITAMPSTTILARKFFDGGFDAVPKSISD